MADYPGQPRGQRLALKDVFAIPGVPAMLLVVLTFVLAHNILYTYIAPFLAMVHMAGRTDLVLLVLGSASLLSIWLAGRWVDRYLRATALASTALFVLATLLLALLPNLAGSAGVVVYPAVAMWGLAFGGAATLFQTALARAAGTAADVAQSMLVTGWNLAIAGGGVIGAGVLDGVGPQGLPAALLVLLGVSFMAIWRAKRHGFPARRR